MATPPSNMSDTTPLRVAVIGCGFFAANQVRAWASMSDVVIAGLCHLQRDRADRLTRDLQLDVPTFADAAKMVRKLAPDFLDIITTPETHPVLVTLAAERKLPAIVQKPMALSLEEAKTMVEAMEAAHLPFMVHENFRFQAPIAALGEVVHSGEIGRPVYAHIAFRTAHDIYKGQPYLAAEKRLILSDVGVHVLDVARFLLGEAERVSVRPRAFGRALPARTWLRCWFDIPRVQSALWSALTQVLFRKKIFPKRSSRSRGNRAASASDQVIRSSHAAAVAFASSTGHPHLRLGPYRPGTWSRTACDEHKSIGWNVCARGPNLEPPGAIILKRSPW